MVRAASLPFVLAAFAAFSLEAEPSASRRGISQAPGRPAGLESRAAEALASVQRAFAEVRQIALQAKQEKDIVRLGCVNDKIDRIVRLLSPLRARLAEVVKKPRGDRTRAAQAARLSAEMAGIAPAVAVLRAQAGQCVGQKILALAEKGEGDDPTYEPVPSLVAIRPPPVSGY